MLTAALFDLDGLLLNTDDLYYEAFNAVLQAAGGPQLDGDYFGSYFGSSFAVVVRALIAAYPELPRDPILVGEAVRQHFPLDRVRFKAGAPQLLHALRAKEVLTVLVTNTVRADVATVATALAANQGIVLASHFDVAITGEQGEAPKPHPSLYRVAVTSLNLPVAECVAFEDSLAGVRSVRAAGLPLIWVPNHFLTGVDLLADTWGVQVSDSLTAASVHLFAQVAERESRK